tara:strand:+ start:3530 stop:4468 length:939 start_codon:yes stop_codon:yes gene_type:complete
MIAYQKRYYKKLNVLLGEDALSASLFPPIKQFKWACLFLTMILLSFASGNPKWRIEREAFSPSKTNIIFLIDTSQNLTIPKSSQDTWFSFGVSSVQKLYRDIEGHFQTSIIAFSSKGKQMAPLSWDSQFAKTTLSTLYVDMPLEVKRRKNLFQMVNDNSASSHHTIAVILSDGHSIPVISPKIRRKLNNKSVSFLFVGLGPMINTPIPILSYSGEVVDYVKNSNGVTILKSQNSDSLRDIASTLNGRYIAIQPDDTIASSYSKIRSELVEQHRHLVSDSAKKQEQPIYFLFLIAAFIVLSLEELIVIRKGRL